MCNLVNVEPLDGLRFRLDLLLTRHATHVTDLKLSTVAG